LRTDIASLQSLLIDTPSGAQTRLGDVADISITSMPNEIKREAASRRIDITCNAKGRDLSAVATDVEAKVRQISFDREYYPEFLGEFAAQQQASRRLLFFSALSMLGIVLMLYVDFQSWRLTGIVMLTITFALSGKLGSRMRFNNVLRVGAPHSARMRRWRRQSAR
jgi:Cu/Ag efflux pump CusA